ncbi:MAG: MOSC domain-containing protein [Pseudomonadota bacterium]
MAHIWRHPIKGIGSEALQSADLTPGDAMVGDRAWALLNAEAADTDDWQPRRNFLQVASGPKLAQVGAVTTEGEVMLTHPERMPLAHGTNGPALADWIGDLWPADRPGPARLVVAPQQGMTDVPFASISVGNLSSLRALSQQVGMDIDMRRFRINLWLDGLAPWEEIDLLERDVRLGDVTLTPVEPIERCRAPDANPATGGRDVSILSVLERKWDTRNFGVYFKVAKGGTLHVGDVLT